MDFNQQLRLWLLFVVGLFCVCSFPALAQTSPGSASPVPLNEDIVVVCGIVLGAMILFFWEPIRLDFISLLVLIVLVVLKPWTRISATEALSGFSSTATITVLAMFVLSEGVRRTGILQIMGERISRYTEDSEFKQVGFISGLSGSIAGFINNTPVVAIFIPLVTDLCDRVRTSPSKLLIPLSYASMLGGMLTLIGTSTNLLASQVSARLLNHPFSMFEFTKLGVCLLVLGCLYLVTLGRYLVPDRGDPEEDLTEEYEMAGYLTEARIREDSPLVDKPAEDALDQFDLDFDLVQIVRKGEKYMEPFEEQVLREDDHLIIRADRQTLYKLLEQGGLELYPEIEVTEELLAEPVKGQKLIEAVIGPGAEIANQTLAEMNFTDRYDGTVLAIRRGEELTQQRMDEIVIQPGDTLLIMATETTLDRLRNNPDYVIKEEIEPEDYRQSKTVLALGIVVLVILTAATGLMPIVISALSGILAMLATGCLNPNEVYESVNWQVIFLLAGLIPLGLSLEQTGAAQYLAQQVLVVAGSYPPLMVLGIFYLLTALLTNVISNNASVVLMIPIAVDAAHQMGANTFSFVLAVTFAASTAFMTPVGYQTNLMVYGPGEYRFRDFFVVGAPLQLLMTLATPLGIWWFWGV